ncbi:hypothetical protein SACS_1183 [Parasaccharibacter apium]|uniref:Uncharacterized protein n=1 Tax=Parasaccharibacter apium TaxID=1510841 RepID=A0A7U7J182_9PROT|nr:hypothetical protein [Parasaccharibacter apium]CDG33921.1 hypothetical protein SACS_1183 [Parasaccharibacter apium]
MVHALGVTPDQKLGPFTPQLVAGLMRAIILMENGENPYGPLVDEVAGVQEAAA